MKNYNFKNCIFKFISYDRDGFFLRNLENRQIYCRYFRNFNDPYESHYGTRLSAKSSNYVKSRRLIEITDPDFLSERANINNEDVGRWLNSNAKALSVYSLKKAQELMQNVRFCSFSKNWKNILMWGHYANGVRGACLIFDKDEIRKGRSAYTVAGQNVDAAVLPFIDVSYSKLPAVLDVENIIVQANNKNITDKEKSDLCLSLYKRCLGTKYKDWRYEEEVRLLIHHYGDIGQEDILYQYNDAALKGVIVGFKSTASDIEGLSKAISPECDIYLTRSIDHKFEISICDNFKNHELDVNKLTFHQPF
jgi:hypothetical protein